MMHKCFCIWWSSNLLAVFGLVLPGCSSLQMPPSAAQRQVEQELNGVLQQQAGCSKTWYNRWFPLLFPVACPVSASLYTGYIGKVPKPNTKRIDSAVFSIVVYDNNKAICGRESKQLISFACYAARRLRPVLATTPPVQWIVVEYSSCVPVDTEGISCSEECYRRVLLSTIDTMQWRAVQVQERRF
jgi:hypothetical protein